MEAKLSTLEFLRRYADDSGVEFGVSFEGQEVKLISQGSHMSIPREEMEWFISAMNQGVEMLVEDE